MKKLLAFNWKMNPGTLKEALVLAKASDYKNVVVAPPFPFLEKVSKVIKKSELGAQDLFWEDKGAFTGEVSAKELKSVAVKYVIIGHSERRHKFDETDEMVAKKMKAAIRAGLIPILCIGETKAEKDTGRAKEVIERQVKSVLSLLKLKSDKQKGNKKPFHHSLFNIPLIVAYEPVWAIGTGNPETPESAVETIKYIKKLLVTNHYSLTTKVLYGGSVNSKNLMNYLQYKEIDGALVGGASLKKDEVAKMIKLIA